MWETNFLDHLRSLYFSPTPCVAGAIDGLRELLTKAVKTSSAAWKSDGGKKKTWRRGLKKKNTQTKKHKKTKTLFCFFTIMVFFGGTRHFWPTNNMLPRKRIEDCICKSFEGIIRGGFDGFVGIKLLSSVFCPTKERTACSLSDLSEHCFQHHLRPQPCSNEEAVFSRTGWDQAVWREELWIFWRVNRRCLLHLP